MQDLNDQRVRHLLSCSPAIIYAGEPDIAFSLTFVSDNFSSIFGYPEKESLNNPEFWQCNIHPDDSHRVFANYTYLHENGHHVHEYRFRKKDGDYVWVLDELRLVRDAAGNAVEVVGSLLDITGRKQTEKALQDSESLFRDFFQINPVATIVTSPAGLVHMVNPAFVEGTGFKAEDVVGHNAQELGFWRVPEDRERMVAAIREFGFIDNLESTFSGKGGKLMTCLISSRAVEIGGELKILSTVTDVTELRKAEDALRKLDQAKSDFISIAAHELRTPLIAIVGYSELLENAASISLTEQQKEGYISIIQDNAEILNRLVDDLLDVGRIQVGRSLGVVFKEHNLFELIEKVVESFKVKNQQHQIVVTHSTPLPDILLIDGGRITQVLHNLLSNAIKYSPHGGVIKVHTLSDESEVSVSVIDQGIGMTPQQVEHIFDRFYRADSANDETSGLGLGMSIVKQIIVDHDGEISITSASGQGSTVTFTLPLER